MESNSAFKEANKNLLYVTNRPPVIMERGEGMYLLDTNGKQYLDFIGGWAVTALGHSPAVVADAICKQSTVLVNASPGFLNTKQIQLAEELAKESGMDRVWFGSSGSEANEAAVKIARKFGKANGNRYEIITTVNSFHGRTLAMMAATGKDTWPELFGPASPGFIHVPFNDLEAVKNAATDKTIAVMLEPVQGEGGAVPADQSYLRGLRSFCDEHSILLILDEVQTGMARTGTMFAFQQYSIEPDILTLGKGIGAGFPLAAVLIKERLNILEAGDHGGTYGGQPLAMAVGLAVLEEMRRLNLAQHVKEMGDYLKQGLSAIGEKAGIANIRGAGLLVGCDTPRHNAKSIVADCLNRGLILNAPRPNTLRFIPPLIAEKKHIDEMLTILSEVLQSS
jgi:acetylornithine/N-succinyldiaminopimelate aminotransferase